MRQNIFQFGNFLVESSQFVFNLLHFQPLQPAQAHIQYGLRLNLGELKSLHQPGLGVVIAGANDVNHFVNIFAGDFQALQNMSPFLGLAQLVAGAPLHHLILKANVFVQHFPKGQDFGLALVVDQGQVDDRECFLHLRKLIQLVEHNLRIGVPPQLDDNAHTVPIGFVP